MLSARYVVRTVGALAVAAAITFAPGCSSETDDSATVVRDSAGDQATPSTPAAPSDQAAPGNQAGPAAPGSAIRHLGPADFATAIGKPGIVLLDVRTPAEFSAGHLAKATNIDMNAADFARQIAKLDKKASYAIYCRTGARSAQAAEYMHAAGFTNIVDLTGGIVAWAAAGGPVTTDR